MSTTPKCTHRPRSFSNDHAPEWGRRFRINTIEPDLLKEVLALKALPFGQIGRLGSHCYSMPLITRSAPASPLRPKSPLEFFLKHSPTPEPKEPKVVEEIAEIHLPPVQSDTLNRKQKRKTRLAKSCVTQ